MKTLSNFKFALIAAATMFAGVSCDKEADVDDPNIDDPDDPKVELIEPFTMEQSEDGMSIKISYDAEAEKYRYATAVCSVDDWADFEANAEGSYEAICEFLESEDVDLSNIDEKFIFEGDAVIDLASWEVEFDKEYIVAAVAYDDKFKQASEVATLEFSTPKEPEPEPEVASFTVEVSDARADAFIVTVDVHNYDGNYTIVPVTQDDIDSIGSLEEYVDAFLADDVASYGTDYSVVDDAYVFSGDCVYDTKDGWNLNSGVEFMVFVVGVEGDGTYAEVVTDITLSDPISTLEGGSTGGGDYPTDIILSDAEFGSIEISNITTTSFDYSIVPSDDTMPYVLFAFTDEEYNTTFPTDEERMIAIYETFAYVAPLQGYTFAEYMEGVSVPGPYAGTYDEMESATTYHVIAIGIDLTTYQPATVMEVESVTTLEPAPITESLKSVTVSDVTFEDAKIVVDAGDYTGYYHMYPVAKETLDNPDTTQGYAGDSAAAIEEAAAYLLNKGYEFDPEFEYASLYYFTGNLETHLSDIVWMVEPETDYYLLVAGFDAQGNRTTSVLVSEIFTTDVAPEFDMVIEVSNISDTSADVSLTPNIKSVDYFNDIVTKSDYDAGITPEYIIENNPYIAYFLNYGDFAYDPDLVDLDPGTEYVVIAFAYDSATKAAISGMFTEEFKTTGEALPELLMPTEVTIPDVDFGTIELGTITSSEVEYTISPAADITHYVCYYMTGAEYDAFASDEDIMLADFARYQEEVEKGWEDSYRDAMEYYLLEGADTGSETWLDSETEYVLYAYGMDPATSLPTTKIKTARFTTLAEEAGAPARSMMKPVETRTQADSRIYKRDMNAKQAVRLSGITAPSMASQAAMAQKAAVQSKPESKLTDRIADRFSKETIRPARSFSKIAK